MTLIVNLYGAPGSGKSTTAAGVFHKLKLNGFNVEYVTEVAKDFTWEGRTVALGCQPYVFGKQYRDIYRLIGQVDVIITDSPILLSAFYNWKYPNQQVSALFNSYVTEQSKLLGGMNFLIDRTKEYNPSGRNQTEEESNAIASDMRYFMALNKISFEGLVGNANAVDIIYSRILSKLGVYDENYPIKVNKENIMKATKVTEPEEKKLELFGIICGEPSYGELIETNNSLEEAEKLAKQYAEDNPDDPYFIVKYIKKVKMSAAVVDYSVDDD